MVLRDLKWLGLDWDEGPDVGGPHGPYRQSERKEIYMKYVDQLVAEGKAYPCFCTDEEIDAMKAEAEEKGLPPIYRGKWKTASPEEVQAELAAGKVPVYRFRVPEDEVVTIQDLVRGDVSWNTDAVGDFVIMRSNGLPVYNFCVTVDDALMRITHVLRAEEHLPNTLRQALIYRALGWKEPQFAHVSIILAPDRSKLSKRHGATSVGQFAEMGYVPQAMINYLALLGWNDGTEKEFFTNDELQEAFTLDRITKSAAVFDKEKLTWMNGQILREKDDAALGEAALAHLAGRGLAAEGAGEWVTAFAAMSRKSLELVADVETELMAVLGYPLAATVASDACAAVLGDDFKQVAEAVLAAHADGSLAEAAAKGELKKVFNAIGKAQERKGKRLFMPLRVALTGTMSGPDVGEQVRLLLSAGGAVTGAAGDALVGLDERMAQLQAWVDAN